MTDYELLMIVLTVLIIIIKASDRRDKGKQWKGGYLDRYRQTTRLEVIQYNNVAVNRVSLKS